MKYLTCYLASVSMLAIVSSGHAFEDPPRMEPTAPVPYVNGPFMSTFDPNLPADAGKPVVIIDTNPTVVELPEALTNPTPLAKQEIGRQTPRTRGAGGEAAPLGGALRPLQSASCPNLDETLRAICDDGIEPKLVADKPGGIGSDYVANREGIADLEKKAAGKPGGIGSDYVAGLKDGDPEKRTSITDLLLPSVPTADPQPDQGYRSQWN